MSRIYVCIHLSLCVNIISSSVQLLSRIQFFVTHGLQHTRPPCPSPTPRVYSNSCPLSQWCHPTISSSVMLFSSCLQSFPVIACFLMSKFFTSVGQSTGVSASASILPMNIQDWFPLAWTCWISLCPRDSQESYQTPQFKTFNSSLLAILLLSTVTSIHDSWKNHSFDYTELFQQSNVYTFKKNL